MKSTYLTQHASTIGPVSPVSGAYAAKLQVNAKIIDLDRQPHWRPIDLTGESSNAVWAFLCVVALALAAVLAMPTRTATPSSTDNDPYTAAVRVGGRALAVGTTFDGTVVALKVPAKFDATRLRAISVAVLSPAGGDAYCSIEIDGVEVDREIASGGGQAICIWGAQRRMP